MSIRVSSGWRKAALPVLVSCAVIAGFAGASGATGATSMVQERAVTPDRPAKVFGTTGAGPNSLVIDANGTVYTANSKDNTVSKITAAGASSILGSTGKQPMGIAIDTDIFTHDVLNGFDN